jgi:hypothetical protein
MRIFISGRREDTEEFTAKCVGSKDTLLTVESNILNALAVLKSDVSQYDWLVIDKAFFCVIRSRLAIWRTAFDPAKDKGETSSQPGSSDGVHKTADGSSILTRASSGEIGMQSPQEMDDVGSLAEDGFVFEYHAPLVKN